MAVTNLQVVATSATTFRLSWEMTGGMAYVYLNGELLLATPATNAVVVASVGEFPIVDVFDDQNELPDFKVGPRRMLTWGKVDGADRYRLEKYNGATWDVVKTTKGVRHRTDVLADETMHQYRIVAIGANEAESTAAQQSFEQVRYPDPPDVTFEFSDSTQKVTIAAV